MALQKQKFSISFVGGEDSKTDDKQVIPGKLLSLENGILTKIGKVIKRNGYGVLGNQLSSGSAICTYNGEIVAFDGNESFSYSKNTDSWVDRGALSAIKLTSSPVIRNTFQQTNADSTIHPDGLQVFTWTDSRGGCRYSCVDTLTGQITVSDILISANASNAKPVALGSFILILYYDTVTTTLRCLPVPILTPSAPYPVFDVSVTMNVTHPNYDVTIVGERAMVAYNSSFGGGSIGMIYVNSFLAMSTVFHIAAENANTAITVFGDTVNQNVWVAYYNGTSVKYFVRSYSLVTVVLAPHIVEIVANIKNLTGVSSSHSGVVYYTQTAGATYNNLVRSASITDSGTVGTPAVFIRSVSICGKAFYYNSVPYFSAVFDTSLQPTIFVINSSAVVVAKISFQLAGGTTVNNMVANSTTIDGINFLLAYTKKDLLDSINGNVYTQTGVESTFLEFTSDNSFQEAQLGSNLHTTGGILQMYDGISFVEHNFNYYPENITNVATTGSGAITAGTRQYVVTYEWQDNQGQTHRSTTSVPVSVTNTTASSHNTLTIPTLRLTQKKGTRNSVQIVVYRTVDVGTVFYQVSSITSPTYNDTTVDTVTFADSLADSAIIGNNLLYTTGGVVDNAQSEATNIITTFKNRVFYVPSDDQFSYNYSKQAVPTTPVEFYDQQAVQLDHRGGKITALAPLDDKIIFFKESALFYMTGDGPDATGSQNDFSEPQLITTDGGCVDASSVVSMPLGLMYKSAKGIYLLNRGLNIEYIGKDVEKYNSDTILSATLVSNKNQVRFGLNTGVVIVYDYLVGQWYTFTNHTLFADSVDWDDTYVYIRSDGLVYQENDSFSDNGNYIKMLIKTGWFSLAGMQGFQRLYKALIIGNYVSKHKLQISAAYDFSDVATETVVIDAYALLNNPLYGDDVVYGDSTPYGGDFPLYQFRYMLPRQKCESIQLTIEDTQTDQIGEGYQLSALGFELGIKEGLNKLGPNRSFS